MIVVQGLFEGGPGVVVWLKLGIDQGFHGINYAVQLFLLGLSQALGPRTIQISFFGRLRVGTHREAFLDISWEILLEA